ncbi:hypothetical protein MMSR116_06645 [Methylobacterium mesophilicum SR1.6/6]|uniref:Ribbon-helix-helix protein, CopG family n=1 Tax=Methylobacterium mesophilicum SR1.6/6 TaxID=908290 RepID=A0A6B9FFB9_9HYPH|nr:hypothetical protein [Methylobacterium mesophilicum]QGY01610.1 hypothetical protein MMSR116_06645 [Methylobacterium mesophilicum SR1.6/6]
MADERERPGRRGRPSLPPGEKKRHSMTFRLRTELRDALDDLAKRDGRSISEQVEYYVEQGVIRDTKFLLNEEESELSEPMLRLITRHMGPEHTWPSTHTGQSIKSRLAGILNAEMLSRQRHRSSVSLSDVNELEFLSFIFDLIGRRLAEKLR